MRYQRHCFIKNENFLLLVRQARLTNTNITCALGVVFLKGSMMKSIFLALAVAASTLGTTAAFAQSEQEMTFFENFVKQQQQVAAQRGLACTIGCFGKFNSNYDTMCNFYDLGMCIKVPQCQWTCK